MWAEDCEAERLELNDESSFAPDNSGYRCILCPIFVFWSDSRTEEGLPLIVMHIKKNNQGVIPPELGGKKVIIWSWDNLANVIKRI